MNLIQHTIDVTTILRAHFYYRNSENNCHRETLPEHPTIHGTEMPDMDKEPAPFNHDYPGETLLEKARRLDLLDTWTPVLLCRRKTKHSYETVTFEGELAEKMWSGYRAWRFGKTKTSNE